MAEFPTSNDDVIFGTENRDVVNGLQGNDYIDGRGGDDELDGAEGDDEIFGSDGNDRIRGGIGADKLNGGSGADHIEGGDGSDTIDGGAGDDVVAGGDGDDLVIATEGRDRATGGSGIDGITATITDYQVKWLLSADFLQETRTINDYEYGRITGFEYFKLLITGGGQDDIGTSTLALDDEVRLGGGMDYFTTYNGHDMADGGDGYDWLHVDWRAATGDVRVVGSLTRNGTSVSGTYTDGAGRSIAFTSFDNILISTGSGNDAIATGAGNDDVRTGAGNDLVDIGAGDDIADGAEGIDGIAADRTQELSGRYWDLNRQEALPSAGYIRGRHLREFRIFRGCEAGRRARHDRHLDPGPFGQD